ncbi:MAG: hypothetical protein MZV70_34870 [Desulfobacterales bacterium]|nr:hypothetical protein [Desulfobacterales bacterium]
MRASTAAPTYFPPEVVTVGKKEFVFVDGGITMYNNPSFQAFLMATVPPYKMGWQTGEDKLLLISIGTGTSPEANENLRPVGDEPDLQRRLASLRPHVSPRSTSRTCCCRVFGKCVAGDALDREVGDLIGVDRTGEPEAVHLSPATTPNCHPRRPRRAWDCRTSSRSRCRSSTRWSTSGNCRLSEGLSQKKRRRKSISCPFRYPEMILRKETTAWRAHSS